MEKIIIETNLIIELDALILKLYERDYFGFLPSAEEYIVRLYDFIYTIPLQKRKLTHNNRYGKYYCTYKHSSKTSWYIVFDVEDGIYLVIFVTNNHSPNYPIIISS